jgi:hypothetical protein
MTYNELVQRVQQQYVAWGRHYPTVLIEGTGRDRIVLGADEFPERSRLVLKIGSDNGWAVTAGAMSGLTRGSIVAFHPPAGEADSEQPLGHGRLTEVRTLESVVEPCEFGGMAAPKRLPPGARGDVVYREYGLRSLNVAIDPSGGARTRPARVAREILDNMTHGGTSLIALVDDVRKADWLVRIERGRAALVPASGWIQGRLVSATPDADSQRNAFGPVEIDEHFADWVRSRLRRIARAENLLSLAAPMGDRRVRVDGIHVELEMLRFADRRDAEGEVIEFSQGATGLRPGDVVGFRVKNQGRSAVDVTLLFLDSGYGITSFFPRAGTVTDNRIGPRHSFVSSRARITADTTGTERMIVIAVKGQGPPTDFSWLEQPTINQARAAGAKRAGTSRSPLAALIEQAAFAAGPTRGLTRVEEEQHCIRAISWHVEQ